MKKLILSLITLYALLFSLPAYAKVMVLAYHDVGKISYKLNNKEVANPWSITPGNLQAHFEYFKKHHYRILSPAEYLQQGNNFSGNKNVLLTFDDGNESFYNVVFPLLKQYGYHAIVAINNEWFNYKPNDIKSLLSVKQMQEMQQSGLVTIVSHTYAMHKFKVVNPQGSLGSIVENRLFINGHYETDEEYEQRLNRDFAASQSFFRENFGQTASVMVWPYGRFSGRAMRLAKAAGFSAAMLLDGGVNLPGDEKEFTKRGIVYNNPGEQGLEKLIKSNLNDWQINPLHVAYVSIDKLYSPKPEVLAGNVDDLIDKLRQEKARIVILPCYHQEQSTGAVSMYFYTTKATVRADIFNYIANRLSQAGIRVLAEILMPDDNNFEVYKDLGDYTNLDGIYLNDNLPIEYNNASNFAGILDKHNQQLNKLQAAILFNRPQSIFVRQASYKELALAQNPLYSKLYKDYLQRYDYTIITLPTDNNKDNISKLAEAAGKQVNSGYFIWRLPQTAAGTIKSKELQVTVKALRAGGAKNIVYTP